MDKRLKRKKHIRKKVSGTAQKPRVYVFKSNKFLYTGVADDEKGVVVTGMRASRTQKGAQDLGKKLADQLKKKKIKVAVFDRSGYAYHGIIASFVESVRDNGIKI